MQIKRLKLSGFKSFVEPAELRIEPGLTGVVGPNGCGKSNVLEAIRWVMGESSPKSMRGSGMDDVIFAGTASRPARDFAEVSLLVERFAEDLPGDLGVSQHGDVEVTRRIERGAGSAYRVNGRDVRAKDVALLFADAATGAHSPALVSQGKISAVIAAKPTERRLMLEEAAGIAGLHVRRKDAEGKLRAAEANLTRLDELLGDMEQRSAALRRQAKAAERYRKLSDQIRIAEGRMIFARWREASEAADAAQKEAETAVAAVEKAAELQRGAAAYQSEAAQALAQRRRAAQEAREQSSALGHKLAALRAERDTISRRIRELGDRRSALAADRNREESLGRDAEAALARLAEEANEIAARLAAAEASRGTIDVRTVALEDKSREAEAALARARAAQAAEQAETQVAQASLSGARTKLGRAQEEAARLQAQLQELGDETPLVEARRAAALRREQAEARLTEAGEAISAAEARRQQLAADRDQAESEGASARAALAALESEAKALLETVEGSSGDRAINHLKVAPGYERALAAALGDDLEAALDGDGPRRWQGTEILASDPRLPPSHVPLRDHVEAPPALARRLAQIVVAEEDDGVPLAVGQRLVTRDGRLRRWDGYVASGLGAAAAERLIRVNRLAEIEKAIPAAAASVGEAQRRIDAALAEMTRSRDAADAARRSEADAAAAIRDAGREEDAATTALERLDIRRTGLAERIAQADADLADARKSLSEAEAIAAALPDPQETDARVADLRVKAEAAQAALAEVRAEAATHARAVSADKQRQDAARKESADWQVRATDAGKRHVEMGRRIDEAEQEAAKLADAPAALAARLEEMESETAEAAAASEAALAAERESEAALRTTEARLVEVAEILASAREARAGAVARHENQESRRIEMARISGERFECPPPLLSEKLGFDEATIESAGGESARHERLSAERERIGPVNLVAERELEELEEGRLSSQAEREELGLAINRLRGSIGSLNREGRARLLAAFEAVDRHFRSLFTTLFDGGQAHLELVESDDPLEAGLEIMAQPPGKRLSALTLLSGGEQALTAVALIFALFLTNPAPICVLDEVDAPLDDANIERFCDLLDRMTGETDTRYLIVTHNAVTMSRMHRLFGVTMVERGISRLVSVDLGGAERLLAAE
ncbi:chromosome segregation protein SMC [Sphingosinicella rhizophila]|uniref:Chromosome partition protein Smc n=1 Tax=Sphingosinicella rhizophila TaxID=3050082 RepID=A0ABU3Q6Z0_9SPHN|nr:chromosome segregation protein SMC [Sphingosinicella sp. GR2756]MDT9599167.1 chromosome segregation protein SMC [Sphingosinicella sp. GR2756]